MFCILGSYVQADNIATTCILQSLALCLFPTLIGERSEPHICGCKLRFRYIYGVYVRHWACALKFVFWHMRMRTYSS